MPICLFVLSAETIMTLSLSVLSTYIFIENLSSVSFWCSFQIELLRRQEEERRNEASASSSANGGGGGGRGTSDQGSSAKVVRSTLPARKRNSGSGAGAGTTTRGSKANGGAAPLREEPTMERGADASTTPVYSASIGLESSATVLEMYFPNSGGDSNEGARVATATATSTAERKEPEKEEQEKREKPPVLMGVGGVPVMEDRWTRQKSSSALPPRLRGTAEAREDDDDDQRRRNLGEEEEASKGELNEYGVGKETRKYVVDDDKDHAQGDVIDSSSASHSGSGSSSSDSAAVFTRDRRRGTRRVEAVNAVATAEGGEMRDYPATAEDLAVGDREMRSDSDSSGRSSSGGSGSSSRSSSSSSEGISSTTSSSTDRKVATMKDPSDDVAAPFAASPAAMAAVSGFSRKSQCCMPGLDRSFHHSCMQSARHCLSLVIF